MSVVVNGRFLIGFALIGAVLIGITVVALMQTGQEETEARFYTYQVVNVFPHDPGLSLRVWSSTAVFFMRVLG